MKTYLTMLPVALAGALAMAACSPRDNQTAGQKADEAVTGAKSAPQDARDASKDAANTVASTASDAMITTKINAALAADDKLKALKINVDTSNGNVVLSGTAPDAGSRERATTLARAVEGVVGVDNRLTVAGG